MRWQMLKCFEIICGQVGGLAVTLKPHLFVLVHDLPGTLCHCVEPVHHIRLWHMLFSAKLPGRPRQNPSDFHSVPLYLHSLEQYAHHTLLRPDWELSNGRDSAPSIIANKPFWLMFFWMREFYISEIQLYHNNICCITQAPEAIY